MNLKRLKRFGLTMVLGTVALTIDALIPVYLTPDIVQLAAQDAAASPLSAPDCVFDPNPGGHVAVGKVASTNNRGHTHKGHADCAICGAGLVLAAVAVPQAAGIPVPSAFHGAPAAPAPALDLPARSPTPYVSRAPPRMS